MTAGAVHFLRTLLLPVFEKYPDRILFAYLFGSAAKEEVTPLSDIDVAVFLSEGTREFYFDTRLSLYADLREYLSLLEGVQDDCLQRLSKLDEVRTFLTQIEASLEIS